MKQFIKRKRLNKRKHSIKKKLVIAIICAAVANLMPFLELAECPAAKAETQISVSADSAIVMDVQSGTILYEKNIDKKQYPASITKIMTALVALENSSLTETVTYSKEAVTNLEYNASNIEIAPGEKLSMEDSLYGILMMSANEACNGVAEHIAGSIDKFVKMMNEKAKELGCTGTHFANANGLWMKNHYTTAHDMAIISRAAYKNPTFAKITGTKTYRIPRSNKHLARSIYNHHGMLYPYKFPQYLYEYCVGGKTGFTIKCRYTLVTYAKKNGMTLVSVVMRVPKSPYEEPNQYTDTTRLMNYCFNHYKRTTIQKKNVADVGGRRLFTKFSPFFDQDSSTLYIDSDAGVVLPKGVDISKTKKQVEYYDVPVESADGKSVIGKVTYLYQGKEVGGSEIFYRKASGRKTLSESFNMTEWVDAAVAEAKKDPVQWKTILIISICSVLLAGVIIFVVVLLRREREGRNRQGRRNNGTHASRSVRMSRKKRRRDFK